jgi:apolipoprotein N-acyltransferase
MLRIRTAGACAHTPAGGALRPWLLGAAGIALLLAAFPPLSLWPLALLVPWPLTLLALEAPSAGAAFRRLYLAGLPFFLLGTAWLAETAPINLVLVSVAEAGWVGFYGWIAWRGLRGVRGFMPALPLLWTAHELLRLKGPLSGYPWLMLGHALARSPVAVQAADLGGVLLLSFVAACGSAALLAWRAGQRRGVIAALAVLVLAAGYGLARPLTLAPPLPGPLLAGIQPAFPQRLKDDGARWEERYTRCMELSLAALRADPPIDLLAWPETMWPLPMGEGAPEDRWEPDFGPAEAAVLEAKALAPLTSAGALRERARPLLLGTQYQRLDEQRRLRSSNSAMLLDATGARLDRYDKVMLVPAGETVPLKAWLPAPLERAVEDWIHGFAGYVIDLLPGTGARTFVLPRAPGAAPAGEPVVFGVTICFENAYGSYCREFVRQGAQFLVNLSNEAWFGTSTEFDQMELHSILRAVETRRALFRVTNSGISCLVRPDGRAPAGADRLVVDGRDRAVAGLFRAAVPRHVDGSLYVLTGDAFGWLCLLASAALVLRRRAPGVP